MLYSCETWSLTLMEECKEECRLKAFKKKQDPEANIMPKRDENGKWRRLHNEELHSSYRSPHIVRVIKSRRLRWAEWRKVEVFSKF